MMRYYIVDAFTDQPFGGNPAGVVLLDGNTFAAVFFCQYSKNAYFCTEKKTIR